ncbi:hypothetical protein Patl1_02578 [Pistacia atlantica]|uniref:Uncharacterized protein n=1 Tax=Pistacia atlantica TaxID=434234 RepID=A0ACC1CD48_9ROSI|nr:hypothetical protein Patl1_02578 [Pistacia atlantica]
MVLWPSLSASDIRTLTPKLGLKFRQHVSRYLTCFALFQLLLWLIQSGAILYQAGKADFEYLEKKAMEWGEPKVPCLNSSRTSINRQPAIGVFRVYALFGDNPLSLWYPNGISSHLVLWPLHVYHKKHTMNQIVLGLFTVSISLPVAVTCANTQG